MKEVNELIRDVATEFPDADPREIAQLVAKRTPRKDIHEWYVDSLVGLVRCVLRNERNSALSGASNKSAKVKQRRQWWARLLEARIHVGEGNWLPLKDCGREELKSAIAERETQIVRTHHQIENLTTLLDRLDREGVDLVGELPPEDLPNGTEL
jgi:hypothetical protein